MISGVDVDLDVLRRVAAVLADAFTADEVVRGALGTVGELPGVVRAGLALTTGGGRQLRFVSTDEDSLTASRVRWCLIDAYAELPVVDVVRSGEDVFAATPGQLEASYRGFASRQRGRGTQSMATLSLATSTQQVGALMVCFDTEQAFDTAQRFLLSALATQVTQALVKGLTYQLRQTTAAQLRRSLLPRSLPALPRLDLGSHYRSGGLNVDVGGDWYDVLQLPDGSTVVALGDVMGKGTPAAVVMGEMRAALRAYAVLDPTPGVVLERMDALAQSLPEQLLTLVYGVVSPDRSSARIALAGHPAPLLLSADEPVQVLPEGPGSAIGVGAGPWPETTVELGPGRTLLLYSNGLVESRDRELGAGIDELVAHAEGLPTRRRQPRELCGRLAQLMTDERTDDDVTLLAVAVPTQDVRRDSVLLVGDATAPGEARRFLRETLTRWGLDEDRLDVAELCVSELVTNAVIHSGTLTELTAQLDEEFLTVLVRDQGGTGTVRRAPADADGDPLGVSGRGLMLVDALSSSWAAEHGADGTTVWFELERESST